MPWAHLANGDPGGEKLCELLVEGHFSQNWRIEKTPILCHWTKLTIFLKILRSHQGLAKPQVCHKPEIPLWGKIFNHSRLGYWELSWFAKLFHQRPYFFSIEADEHCRFDFIAVYDGSSTTSGLMGQVCGYVKPTFESSSDSLTVVLSTDYANSYRGFSASYTSIYAENINTSKSCSLAILSSWRLWP